MSATFGIDLDELSSAVNAEANEEICIKKPCSSSTDVAAPSTSTKRKADDVLRTLIESNVEQDASSQPKKPRDDANEVLDFMPNVPRTRIYNINCPQECTHQVAVPPDFDYQPPSGRNANPPKTYPFTLDPFQAQALVCIDNNQSVMVSAHTSAGKTVVAEYAVATGLAASQRVIYTTPIKALSNQKFREFSEQYPEVGLLTGDATINPNANVLIMTTEILQSMLYRGSHIIREVGWVIFDEIHYMRDPERGVVWEEAIVLLPDSIKMVFLSATIPNARQFAEWVAYLHKQPCHVVTSERRPVPLRHYLFPVGSDGLYLVLDQGNFMESNFNQAVASIVSQNALQRNKTDRNEKNVVQIIKLVKYRSLEPIIIFSFSKKECEIYALQLAKLDFTTDAEKRVVEEVFVNAVDCLSAEDKSLPQVRSVLPLLKKGIGIHHGGLLPILKETVEILFSEGLVKCLFATETFAMGLNMPARTVLFTSARKFDGTDYRWLTPSEYIQMSGRAGRRGKDASGTVIFMLEDSMTPEEARTLLMGQPDPLISAFHITYNMLLNLMRVEEVNPEYLMERSFCQFQNFGRLPNVFEELENVRRKHAALQVERADEVQSYHLIKQCIADLDSQKWRFIHRPQYVVPFLQTGRLVRVQAAKRDFGWGIVLQVKKRTRADRSSSADTFYIIDCLLWMTKKADTKESRDPLPPLDESVASNASDMMVISDEETAVELEESAEIVPVRLNCITGISAVRVIVPKDLRTSEARKNALKTIERVKKTMDGRLPDIDPVSDMHIKEPKFLDLYEKLRAFESRLEQHSLHGDPNRDALCAAFVEKDKLRQQIDKLTSELKGSISLIKLNELDARKRLLRRLQFCSDLDDIKLKGRVACEITSADEIMLTELLFDGIFNKLSAEQVAALLSCFVCEERGQTPADLDKGLLESYKKLQDTARKVAQISVECRLELDVEEYVGRFRSGMMSIVFDWASGKSFSQICESTSIFEGNIVRTLRRLEELIRQLANAAHTIDNTALEATFNRSTELIKRDIVFAASLYL